jgi:hypothetical protein
LRASATTTEGQAELQHKYWERRLFRKDCFADCGTRCISDLRQGTRPAPVFTAPSPPPPAPWPSVARSRLVCGATPRSRPCRSRPAIGITGIFAAVVSVFAVATDTNISCFDLLEENGKLSDSTAELPFLTGNQCEAPKRRELRVPFLKIPQEKEGSMSLSVGTKGDGATLYFKIPFSF